METIKKSEESKWTTIARTMACCSSQNEEEVIGSDSGSAAINVHPMDCSVNLSVHQPLYPPGRIIHIVRHHPKQRNRGSAPVYQAVWADNRDFDKVLISKRMIQDHMPDNVLDALEKASSVHAWHTVSTFQGRRGVLIPNTKAEEEKKKNENEDEEKEEEEDQVKILQDSELRPERKPSNSNMKPQLPLACAAVLETSFEYNQVSTSSTSFQYNETSLKLSGTAHRNISTISKEMHTCTQRRGSYQLASEDEGPDTERSTFYIEGTKEAPLASPDALSLCSRISNPAIAASHCDQSSNNQCGIQATKTYVISETVQNCPKATKSKTPSTTLTTRPAESIAEANSLGIPLLHSEPSSSSPEERNPPELKNPLMGQSPARREELLHQTIVQPSFSDFSNQEATVV